MTIGVALLLIFALHLVDKYNRWSHVVKLAVYLMVLGAVTFIGLLVWAQF